MNYHRHGMRTRPETKTPLPSHLPFRLFFRLFTCLNICFSLSLSLSLSLSIGLSTCFSLFPENCAANPKHDSETHSHSNPLQHFQVEGKVAFSQHSKGGNASIFWQQQGNKYHIRLVGALGAGSLEVYGRPGFVGLVQSDGKSYKATEPEQLIQQVLGWDIPVSPLRYWLQGKMVPGTKSGHAHFDNMGRLMSLQQMGWSIHYDQYIEQQGRSLPTRIILQNGAIRLKFIFRRWKVLS